VERKLQKQLTMNCPILIIVLALGIIGTVAHENITKPSGPNGVELVSKFETLQYRSTFRDCSSTGRTHIQAEKNY